MKKKNTYLISTIIMIIAISFCIIKILEIKNVVYTMFDYAFISLYNEEKSNINNLTDKEFDNIKQNFEYIVGEYQIFNQQKIIAYDIDKNVTTDLIEINFDSNIIFKSNNILYSDDLAGCLIDRDTMYLLFGTEISNKQILTIEGKDYIVRGIIDEISNAIVIQKVDNIQNEKKDKKEIEKFGVVIIDCSSELYRNQYFNSISNILQVQEIFYVKDYYSIINWIETPSKWSDFGFFKEYNKKIKEKIEYIIYGKKDIVETMFYKLALKQLGYVILLCICITILIIQLVLLFKLKKKSSKNKL